jgi:hypothetical protein
MPKENQELVTSAKTLSLTNGEVISIAQAISELPAFKGATKANYFFAKALRKLKQEIEVIEEERKKLWETIIGKDKQANKNDPNFAEYLREYNKLLLIKDPRDVQQIELEKLNLDENPVSPEALEKISVLISDF